MKVLTEYPPNIAKLKEKFTINDGVIFTHGDTIYNPAGISITPDLMAHEETHELQQGDKPDQWWEQYLEDPDFRVEQEGQAYRKQYQYFKTTHKDRNEQARFLHMIATHFSSGIYGHAISYEDAVQRIKNA